MRAPYYYLLPLVLALAACGSDDKPALKGERLSVLELQKSLKPDAIIEDGTVFTLPDSWQNEFWPQAGGYPNHSMQHLALNEGSFKQLWTAKIGKGSSKRMPLVTRPIVVDGRVFTLDTDSHLSAFDANNGKQHWQVSVRPRDEEDPVIGGGIAFSNAVLYVTTGYDELLAIDPSNGKVFWRKDLPAPSRAAPTIMDNRLYVTTLDSRVLALNPKNGDLLWEYVGISETAGLLGAASPAANYDIVIPVFSSGEVTALRVENGSVAWSDNLSNLRAIGGLGSLSDIKALPVIDRGLVIVMSFSGRLVAIDERTGNRVWQREIGGSQTPWVAGSHIFALSEANELIALNRATGAILWVTELDKTKGDKKITWAGPVLAGNRLLLTGSDGRLLEVVPETGQLLAQSDLGSSFVIPPIIANKTLYLLSENGTLMALR